MWFLFGGVSSSTWCFGMGYVILLWHSLSLPYNYKYVSKKHVRGLCVTMVIKLHDVLVIITKFVISVTSLIKGMFRFIAIYYFLKSNHAR